MFQKEPKYLKKSQKCESFLDSTRPQGQQIAPGASAFNYRGMINQR